MTHNNPRSFVLQLGSLIALYVSVTALLMLLFGVINVRYPDEATSFYNDESARMNIRNAIALLIVFFPTYLVLTRISNQNRRRESAGEYAPLAKWVVYLSLLIAGGALLGDLVTIIMYFLNGEITVRFILKAFVFLVIVASAFTYYLFDIRGYFVHKERTSKQIGMGAALLVAISLVAGFMYIETPAEVREIRLDERQVEQLQDMQFRIQEYYSVRGGFPESIDDLYNGEHVPEAPEGRPAYRYVLTGETSYELCATFAYESRNLGRYPSVAFPMKQDNYTWDHGVGEKCFARIIESTALSNESV